MMKCLREDLNLNAYDLMDIWRMAYRIGFIEGHNACENEAPLNPRNDSIPEFIWKLLAKEKSDNG